MAIIKSNEYISFTIEKTKHIALIAHDSKKDEMIEWVKKNLIILNKHFLYGTGTTAKLIADKTELPIRGFNSGPLGGDAQISAKIVEGRINMVIFLWDPLESQPHDPDVKALQRIAAVYDIPIAQNVATADFLINSKFMEEEYTRKVLNFSKYVKDRVDSF